MQVNLNIALKEEYPRLCFAEMPVLTRPLAPLFNYTQDADIAVVVPIFRADGTIKYSRSGDLRVHGFAKRAMWLSYELLNWTDLREQGVSLYLSVTQSVRDIFLPYAEACGFPSEHILWSDIQETDYCGNIPKFPLMRLALMNPRIQRVMHLDSAIYFMRDCECHLFRSLKAYWKDAPLASFFPIWSSPEAVAHVPNDLGNIDYHRAYGNYDKTYTEENYLQKLSDAMNMDVESFKRFWMRSNQNPALYIEGRTLGKRRSVLESENLWELLDSVRDVVGNDEGLTALYWQKCPSEITHIPCRWYPPMPNPISEGDIGFLDSSKSFGEISRREWMSRMAFNLGV